MEHVTNGETPEVFCHTCQDYGMYEVCHPSTDAIEFWAKCEHCPMIARSIYMKVIDWRSGWKPSAEELAELPPF
jgi:hypothetical protein